MSPNTLAKLGRHEDVSMDVLKRICAYLQCDIGNIDAEYLQIASEILPGYDGQ